jgi:hypothetical protein
LVNVTNRGQAEPWQINKTNKVKQMKKVMYPEATDAVNPTEGYDPNDPMNQPVEGIDTSFPKLPAGLYAMEVKDAVIAPSKSTPGAETATVKLVTIEDAVDTQGEFLNKGFPVYYRFGVTPTPEYDAKTIAKKIATLLKHCGFTSGVVPRQFLSNPAMIVGKLLTVKIGIQKESNDYPESNQVKAFVDVK